MIGVHPMSLGLCIGRHLGDKMEFKRTSYEIDIYGEKLYLTAPTRKQARKYYDDLMATPEGSDFNIAIKDFLASLGFKEELFDEMELEHIQQLVDFVLGAKKK